MRRLANEFLCRNPIEADGILGRRRV